MKKLILPISLLIILSGCTLSDRTISFEDCVISGNPSIESYPEECKVNNQNFIEESVNPLPIIGTEEVIRVIDNSTTSIKGDTIILTTPITNGEIHSPLNVTGQAPGLWFFEASFPVILKAATGQVMAQGVATAQSDWMTEDPVPFTAELKFALPAKTNKGTLILEKANASDLEELNDSYSISVIFGS